MTDTPAGTLRRAAALVREDAMRPEADDPTQFSRTFELSIADLFDAVAAEMDDYGSVIEDAGAVKVAPAADGFRYDQAPPWTKALAAARAYLGDPP